jgi:hypothetical protein
MSRSLSAEIESGPASGLSGAFTRTSNLGCCEAVAVSSSAPIYTFAVLRSPVVAKVHR